jgi:hypothetical protein
LLLNRPVLDFFALLFVPISMSAVLFYGKHGFLWIAAFSILSIIRGATLRPRMRPGVAVGRVQ